MAVREAGAYVAAVDIGSSRIRAAVFDLRGQLQGTASATLPVRTSQDLAPLGKDLHPQTLWSLACGLLRQARQQAAALPSEIKAIGVAAQREGMVFLDAEGVELYAGPNTDLRAFIEGQTIDAEHAAEVYEVTGRLPSFLFAPAKLLWLKNNQPDAFERVRWALSLDAWLAWELSGEMALETAMAGELGLLEVTKGTNAGGLMTLLGLPANVMPRVVPAGSVIGQVTKAVARASGLVVGTPVVAAGPDTQLALLGMGLVADGDAGIVAGWSAPIQLVLTNPVFDAGRRTWTGRHVVPGRWVLESNAGETGYAYAWARGAFFPGVPDDASLSRLAAKATPGADGALAFLGPRRANMSDVSASMGGLVFPLLSTVQPVRREAMARAVLESIAFAIRANIEQLEEISGRAIGRIGLGGGMASNSLLAQMIADVLGKPVRVAASQEATALGAAICAAAGSGAFEGADQAAAAMVRPYKEVTPKGTAPLEYPEHYQRWLAGQTVLDTLRAGL